MTYPTQSGMHAQHVEWRSQHTAWLEDLGRWQSQNRRVLADLARLEAIVQEHMASLLDQAELIHSHDRQLAVHEREIGMLQEAGVGEQYDPQTPGHEAGELKHKAAAEGHARVKQHHHQVITEVRKLIRSAAEKL